MTPVMQYVGRRWEVALRNIERIAEEGPRVATYEALADDEKISMPILLRR